MIRTFTFANEKTMKDTKELLTKIYDKISSLANIKRYGVRIDKHNPDPYTRVEYIHDAVGMIPAHMDYSTGKFDYGSWGDIWFVKDNIPVVLNNDGTVRYSLNPNDYSLKSNGDKSDIYDANFTGNVMSKIPLIWLHMSEDDDYEYIVISNEKYDESYYAFAHYKSNGTIAYDAYLSIYSGCLVDTRIRSLPNKAPVNVTQTLDYLAAAKANGTNWNIRSWSERQLINSLLLIMGKSEDAQSVFGRGVVSTANTGYANNLGMSSSGTLDKKGQFYGSNTNGVVKVFHMENWWGNQWELTNGLVHVDNLLKISMIGPYSNNGTNYAVLSHNVSKSKTSGFKIKNMRLSKFGRIPCTNEEAPSNSSYVCDSFFSENHSAMIFAMGGDCASGNSAGPNAFKLFKLGSDYGIGAGLSYL